MKLLTSAIQVAFLAGCAAAASNSTALRGISDQKISGQPRQLRLDENDFVHVGCFGFTESSHQHNLKKGLSLEKRAAVCNNNCHTPRFAVRVYANGTSPEKNSCRCFGGWQELKRLSLGGCKDQGLELYLNPDLGGDFCGNDNSRSVRDFLVDEDNTDFGFDIVTNEFRWSPFELYKSECGTNIYEVHTDVSGASSSITTTSSNVIEFAMSRRDESRDSWEASASFGYSSDVFSVGGSVSASGDKEQTALLTQKDAAQTDVKLFTTSASHTVAEIDMKDFDYRNHFVTLSDAFVARLREYKEAGFQFQHAKKIIDDYGQFVLTQGLYGGYSRQRSYLSANEASLQTLTELEQRDCFQAAAEIKGAYAGFEGSVGAGGSKCSEQMKSAMRDSMTKYSDETGSEVIVGGSDAQSATLLTSKEHYPDGKEVKFRLITDFLDPSKISPYTVKTSSLTEDDFGEIKDKLQIDILTALQHVQNDLLSCDCHPQNVRYLVESDDGWECQCYEPQCPAVSDCSLLGAENSWTDCDGDGILDSVCVDSRGNRGARLSKDGCNSNWPNAPADSCPQAFDALSEGCIRPDGWCEHHTAMLYKTDCDGDGVMDNACIDLPGAKWVQLSTRGCQSLGGVSKDTCPQAFDALSEDCISPDGWCEHHTAMPYKTDCDGDGVMDNACIDAAGAKWVQLSTRGCRSLGGVSKDACPKIFGL